MASFNLGYIRGDKGDPGPKGDKGDTGETGARGTDGITPVFTIGKVYTVSPSLGANVEIDSSDVANPRLDFYIPSGEKGKDALGDMAQSIYDSEGRKTDIYKFCEELFESCIKKSGGKLSGVLSAFGSEIGENCIRNISFLPSLPETASYGDICFVVSSDNETPVSEHSVGSIIILKEGNFEIPYIIAAKDYHGKGTVSLIRKDATDFQECFDYNSRDRYFGSDIDLFLESIFMSYFSDELKKYIKLTEIETDYYRFCFLPSTDEMKDMEYFRTASLAAQTTGGNNNATYITREVCDAEFVYAYDYRGILLNLRKTAKRNLRPIIVLKGDTPVENTEHKGNAAVKLAVEKTGMYFYENGQWKEFLF